MTILDITFYALIGLGVAGIIGALIWTKLIKPDTSADKLNKLTSFPLLRLRKVIKTISNDNRNVFYNILINKSGNNNKSNIFIPGIVITSEKIYLFASPVYTDKDIRYNKGKYLYKKDMDLKFDLWFDRTSAYLAKELKVDGTIFELVIPAYKKGKANKKIKKLASFEEISNNPKFKESSENSKAVFMAIGALNITNFKQKKFIKRGV